MMACNWVTTVSGDAAVGGDVAAGGWKPPPLPLKRGGRAFVGLACWRRPGGSEWRSGAAVAGRDGCGGHPYVGAGATLGAVCC